MALATSAWRESLARAVRIQTSKSWTRGAICFARTARRCAGGKPLIDRSHSKIASNHLTALSAMGETITGFFDLALVAISARTKNFLLACAQHAASVIGPRARSPL